MLTLTQTSETGTTVFTDGDVPECPCGSAVHADVLPMMLDGEGYFPLDLVNDPTEPAPGFVPLPENPDQEGKIIACRNCRRAYFDGPFLASVWLTGRFPVTVLGVFDDAEAFTAAASAYDEVMAA